VTTVHENLEALLDGRVEPSLDQLEDTLTTGYAAALQIEGERLRLERELRDALRRPRPGASGRAEFERLRERLVEADVELRDLRELLSAIRRHVYDPRVARGRQPS
jgi:hypothetical protein